MIKQIGKYEFPQNIRKFKKAKKDIPNVLATNSVNHFQEGFRKGGFQTDDSSTGWKRRKRETRESARRGILIGKQSGTLWRDIRKKIVKWSQVVIGTSSLTDDYASVHNEGKGNMPQREFIGDSKKLTQSNLKLVDRYMDKVMNV